MKIRSKRLKSLPGGELWVKKSLGSEPLVSYMPRIEKHVGSFAASCVTDSPRVVDVDKIRCKSNVGLVDREICQILKNNYTKRSWLTLSLEGSEEEISKILKTNPEYQSIYEALSLILLIVQSNRTDALRTKFFPVLSDYPAWLNILHSDTPEQSSSIVYDDCASLLVYSGHQKEAV